MQCPSALRKRPYAADVAARTRVEKHADEEGVRPRRNILRYEIAAAPNVRKRQGGRDARLYYAAASTFALALPPVQPSFLPKNTAISATAIGYR